MLPERGEGSRNPKNCKLVSLKRLFIYVLIVYLMRWVFLTVDI